MPGLEPADIAVTIRGDHLTICGEYRGSRHDQPEILLSEWTVGPYYREVSLPQLVDGELTNATYGNGVLVLSTHATPDGYTGDHTVLAPAFTATGDELAQMVERFAAAARDVETEIARALDGP